MARSRAFRLATAAAGPERPREPGLRVLEDHPLGELLPYVDWTPFFQAWELKGRWPAILSDARLGDAARKLFADANVLLDRIVRERLLRARGVFGIFPANAVGDDVEVYADEDRHGLRAVLHTLRQQGGTKPADEPCLALADFVAPRSAGAVDHVGAFVVSTGTGLDALVRGFEAAHDDYSAILCKALADRLAEAFAERCHQLARVAFGYGAAETFSPEDLRREAYRGIRPAPGYPACPDHTEKRTIFRLLDAEAHTGAALTETCAVTPASSVCGLYFFAPEARYFSVGRVGRDQVQDYARRKGIDVAAAEAALRPILGYDA